jgi:hypothetical protein
MYLNMNSRVYSVLGEIKSILGINQLYVYATVLTPFQIIKLTTCPYCTTTQAILLFGVLCVIKL